MPAAWWTTTDELKAQGKYHSAHLLTVLPIYSTHVTATGRSVLLHEGKLCADGTLCSPNIARVNPKLGRSRSPTMFNIPTSNTTVCERGQLCHLAGGQRYLSHILNAPRRAPGSTAHESEGICEYMIRV